MASLFVGSDAPEEESERGTINLQAINGSSVGTVSGQRCRQFIERSLNEKREESGELLGSNPTRTEFCY